MEHFTQGDRAGGNSSSPALSPAQELSAAEENEARLAADALLISVLRAEGFQGPLWSHFQQQLTEYGWSVLMKWIQDGQIFRKCGQLGRGIAPTEAMRKTLQEDRETRSDLAVDTVIAAMENFRESLIIGRWKPGSSRLTTYFIGACIRSFPNAYRRLIKSAESPELLNLAEMLPILSNARGLTHGDVDPANIVIAKESEQNLIKTLPTNVQKIAALRAEGYTNVEIAELLELSVPAVEARLARERRRRKRRG